MLPKGKRRVQLNGSCNKANETYLHSIVVSMSDTKIKPFAGFQDARVHFCCKVVINGRKSSCAKRLEIKENPGRKDTNLSYSSPTSFIHSRLGFPFSNNISILLAFGPFPFKATFHFFVLIFSRQPGNDTMACTSNRINNEMYSCSWKALSSDANGQKEDIREPRRGRCILALIFERRRFKRKP